MAKNLISILLGVTLLSIILSKHQASAQCCSGVFFRFGLTHTRPDNTSPTPCCGHGRCNFFCCSCDGGCRGKRWIRDVSQEHLHDTNQDGFYDIVEAHNRLLSGACGNYTEKVGQLAAEFDKMDKDKDGKLSYEEING
ncbi:unnamed protein product [Orchesella dallaii]|uniref:EF-hand domain-containing protein n=1 Tax=Orchesella dallaii TaxID=48710 RepID=A0ABP1RPY2_9HEXA